jgi:lipopolysaccharide export LptBFGC system permease protein LptF
MVWRMPAPGDISQALTQHPEMYTLSMGHLSDLTLNAFAYLKLPLAVAIVAFAAIAAGLAFWRKSIRKTVLVIAIGMIIFFQAARLALVRFDGRDNWWKPMLTTLSPLYFSIPDARHCC